MADLTNHPYAKSIWDTLLTDIGNEYGVAGIMGNLQAESGLYPDRVQGDIPYSAYSQEYTENVNNGVVSEYDFVHNGPNGGGYGLAQWTYYTRKQALYNMYKSGNYTSIGSVKLACDYLLYELKNDYATIYNAAKNATEIRSISDLMLHDFENPAEQGETVEVARANMGTEIYNEFSGSEPIDPEETPDTGETDTKKGNKLSKLLLMAIATDIY